MMSINDFIAKYYIKSVELKEKFKITENKEWDGLTVLNELQVQLGHVSHLISTNKSYGERERNITNIGDELSDVLLQIFSYSTKLNIDIRIIKFEDKLIEETVENSIINLLTILGQLSEITLEYEGFRHYKIRYGFPKVEQYILNLFENFFQIVFSIINILGIDIDKEYNNMLIDANKFLDKFKIKKNINYYPIVDMHATWLVLNPVQGCPKKCKYCFLAERNLNGVLPNVLISPEVAIDQLIKSEMYMPDIPLCLFSQTDAFVTKENIEYIKQLIYLIDEKKINNPIIFISKCEIPDSFIDFLDPYIKKGHKFIFFLSYSGLESDIELGVVKKQIEDNFIKLKRRNINIIHYWRPFLPQNSSKEQIDKIYNFVRKYADASIIIGLKTSNSIIDNIDWKELTAVREDAINSDNVWTKEAYDYVWNELKYKSDYPIFQTTSCALALVLKKAERKFFYNTKICNECNLCPISQRKICFKNVNKRKKIGKKEVQKILKKLNIKIEDKNIEIKEDILYLKNTELKRTQISMITELLQIKTIACSSVNDYYWNTSINNKEILKL